jgi:RHS repeat-associated protein
VYLHNQGYLPKGHPPPGEYLHDKGLFTQSTRPEACTYIFVAQFFQIQFLMATNASENSNGSSQFLKTDGGKSKSNAIEIPSINLPKGGGAIKGIDEKFSVNAINGTASFSIPLPFSSARGVTPSLSLNYNSGSGNGAFGLGWQLSLASIKRKTDKGLPQYFDGIESDTFLFSETDELVPEFKKELDGSFSKETNGDYIWNETDSPDTLFTIKYYKPRIEGLFARIERWTEKATGIIKWRVITRDNVTTLFGWTENARISNPNNATQTFEWLLEYVFDDKGNCSNFIYKKENADGLNLAKSYHKNRIKNSNITYTNTYLQKVLYGNKTTYGKFGDSFKAENDYMFSSVFDYGEYEAISPFANLNNWNFRADAFSDYRAGFEIRTTRLCKRVMLFHHFTGANEYDGLVKSLDFEYDTTQNFTFLNAVTAHGYIKNVDGNYSQKQLPATEFFYQKQDWNKEIKSISKGNLTNLPSGLDEQQYHFVDLYNEGLSGILTEQAESWQYKHNLGNGNFEAATLVSAKPSFSGFGNTMQLVDLEANGIKQLVNFGVEPKGYFEQNEDQEWQQYKYFKSMPNVDFGDENTRMLDLDGDGKPELLISDENIFTWYASDGRNGFSAAQNSAKAYDEEEGPKVVFSNDNQSIFLADMSGDGMTDIVRIKNAEICYWPNLGYGKFGAKIAMENAPKFDFTDAFNPNYLRLADIDGSGTTDIIYLGKNKFSCWMNLSGNSFAIQPFEIESFTNIHQHSKTTVTDLLGNGVACLVWSSSLEKDSNAPLKYVDIMNSKKPHIMVGYKNNLGKEVSFEYSPSTQYYLADKLAGNPWITKLHFPVHCVSKTETIDKITGHKFVTTYQYHHGYYDHAEREFRGFGMMEQTDSEYFEHWVRSGASNIVSAELHQEPVLSKTWVHTGAYFGNEKILSQYEQEYWQPQMIKEGFSVVNIEKNLPAAKLILADKLPANLINNLSTQEWQEALRACKGMSLRTETFAKDATKNGNTVAAKMKELTPFSVGANNCIIELLQPKGQNKHAIFMVKQSEAIKYSYERNAADPRISHTLNLQYDAIGNVLESASVVYPRKIVDNSLPLVTKEEQTKTIIIYTKSQFTNDVIDEDIYRLRLTSETKTFELKAVNKTDSYYKLSDFYNILSDVKSETALYHDVNKVVAIGMAQKRLIEHIRTNYYRNNLINALPLHQLESLALPFESYQLAYSPEMISDIYGAKITDDLLTEGKFVHNEGDNNWWVRSGVIQYIEGAENAINARNRFMSPISFTDPFGTKTKVKYYGTYFTFIAETEDAIGNKSTVDKYDFRSLTASRIKDMNENISASITDEMGLVKAVAMLGKGNEADELTGFKPETDDTERGLISDFFNSIDANTLIINGKNLIKRATMVYVYDFDAFVNSGKPAVVSAITREQHFQQNNDSPIQIAYEYSSGMGEVIMKKVQAEPGKALQITLNNDDTITTSLVETGTNLRWIGNGRIIKNNKGNAVKKYEPYFSINWHYESFKELVETGVTPVMYYDAESRIVKTNFPNGTLSKTEYTTWSQTNFDTNDTVLAPECTWYLNRTNRLIDAELLAIGKSPIQEKTAAEKTAKHANTPNVLHLDTLGRPILTIEHNKNIETEADEFYQTLIALDAESNLRNVTDARGNIVMVYKYDMLGNVVYQNSMDAGQRWLLTNALNKPLRTWDERNHELQYFYDSIHRPTETKVMGGEGLALNNIFDKIIYGESIINPELNNLRGKVYKYYDTGGLIETPEYDFKGQVKVTKRRLFKDYKSTANWIDANLENDLEIVEYKYENVTDALDRITKQTAPDGSIIRPTYNQAGLLSSETIQKNGQPLAISFIKKIDYNEKRQRNKIVYGNDVTTKFYYDKETFNLNRLETFRANNQVIQNLNYTYDAVGNIIVIEDKAIPINFFANAVIEPKSEYTYDALYRLAKATGRENNAALNFGNCDNWNDNPFKNAMNAGDPMAVRNYTQQYDYDQVGNILEMKHLAIGGNWTRNYQYENANNRLLSTSIGNSSSNANYTKYKHHTKHGYLEEMPHLEVINWNFKEQVLHTSRQNCTADNIPVLTYYQYDGNGQRIRKVTENSTALGGIPTKKEERIYLAGYELFKKYTGSDAGLERSSLSLMDEGHRFVTIETRNNIDDGSAVELVRYQLHNHQGSAALELDGSFDANVISYEEFHPFGTTAYQANNATIKSTAKRYRFTGMERDDETGLEYHSARYYVPWLGRWLSADPTNINDGVNLYRYCNNSPCMKTDKSGKQADPSITAAARISSAMEAADRADFSDESVNAALDAIDAEISSRGYSYYFTRDAVIAHALLRAEAYARHERLGNYGRATFHGTMGVIDSFGYAMYGDTAAETGRNFAISLVVGAAFSRLAAAGRAAQLETTASADALAARVAARRALPPPPPELPPAAELPPTVPPPVETPPTTPPTRSGGGSTTVADPDATPPHGTRIPVATPAPRLATTVRDGFYAISDTSNPRFQAVGELSAEGSLSVTLRTQLETGVRSTVLRGAEAFQSILTHFGSAVRSIRGSWQFGTNLATFNELTAGGMAPEAAAAQTWTAQQAARAGFTQITMGAMEGTPGHYTHVNVTFTRP